MKAPGPKTILHAINGGKTITRVMPCALQAGSRTSSLLASNVTCIHTGQITKSTIRIVIMRIEKIAAHELRFDKTGKDSNGFKHSLIKKSIEVSGQGDMMNYVDASLASGDESYYYRSRFEKDQIVLHFTMGYLGGDIATLSKHDYHVLVPFVLGRNGTIYRAPLFIAYVLCVT